MRQELATQGHHANVASSWPRQRRTEQHLGEKHVYPQALINFKTIPRNMKLQKKNNDIGSVFDPATCRRPKQP